MNASENMDSDVVVEETNVDLSIIIVNYNVWDLLRSCIRSIEQVSRPLPGAHPTLREFGPAESPATLELICVDNCSSDATVDLLPALFPWVQLIVSDSNLGFTAGNNRGYAASSGRFVYFLNPDTELLSDEKGDDSLWDLYATLAVDDADEQIALVGPRLMYGDGRRQNNRRRFATPYTGFFESTRIQLSWPDNPWARRYYMDDWADDMGHDVDWLVGAAMLARRAALEQVRMPQYQGPFDESFFMYSEEVDLCHRLKDAGWRIAYRPQATVIHYEGQSSDQEVAARHINFNISKVHYYQKYFGSRWAWIIRLYIYVDFVMRMLIEMAKGLLGHKPKLRRQRVHTYRQVLASRFAPRQSTLNSSQKQTVDG